ncbi:MAG: substrate-binding domain-containing protein [Patulibacter sp.]
MKRVRLKGAMLAGAIAAFGLVGCGSDDESSTTTAASGGDTPAASSGPFVSAEIATAFEEITGQKPLDKPATAEELGPRVEAYKAVPKDLLLTEPVTKKAEAGKHIALLVCGVPVCAEFNNAAKEAADLLGWKTTRVDLGTSPEDFANAYNRAIELKPDLVVGSGLSRELFDKQLNTLAEMNIPVIQWSSGIKPVEDKLFVAVDDPFYQSAGVMAAEVVAADGDLKSDVAVFNVPQYTMSTLFAKTFESYIDKACADCKVSYQEAAATDIGKLAQKVTAHIQRNPDTTHVVCSFGDLCQGVGQALKTAGRDDIKIYTQDPGATNFQNIVNGTEWGATPLAIGQTGWQIIDLAQRIFNEGDVAGTRLAPMQAVVEISDPKSPLIGAVPDYKEQYKALWKLEG